MLQTRFVLLIENSMIRRHSITRVLWMMNTVSARFHSGLSRSSGNLCELTDFTIRILRKMAYNIGTVSWLASVRSLGPFRENKKIGWLFFGTHPHLIKCFLFRLDCRLSHHDTVWFSEVCQRGKPSSKSLSNSGTLQSVTPCLGWILLAWDIGQTNFARLIGTWDSQSVARRLRGDIGNTRFSDLHLATFPFFASMGPPSPFSFLCGCRFVRRIFPEIVLLVNLPKASSWQRRPIRWRTLPILPSSLPYRWRSWWRWVLMIFWWYYSKPEVNSFLLTMWRDAPLSTMNSLSSWWQTDRDATTFSWVVLFGGVGKFVTCLDKSSFAFCECFPCFLRTNSTLASINSAQLPSCSYDRAFGLRQFCPLWCSDTQRVAFRLALNRTGRCATRDGRHFFATSVRWKNRYTTQKVSLRSEFQRGNFLSCLGDNQRFGDCHRILSLFLFASSLLGVLVRTLILKFATSLWWK